jgi:hypothetical protein
MKDMHSTSYELIIAQRAFFQKRFAHLKPKRRAYIPFGKLSLAETAWELGIPENTLRAWHKKGIGPKKQLGMVKHHVYYGEMEVKGYWKNHFRSQSQTTIDILDYKVVNN